MQLSRTNLGVRFLFEIASVASYSPNPTVLFLLENPLSNSQVVAKVSLLSVYPVNKCVEGFLQIVVESMAFKPHTVRHLKTQPFLISWSACQEQGHSGRGK